MNPREELSYILGRLEGLSETVRFEMSEGLREELNEIVRRVKELLDNSKTAIRGGKIE